jgi:transcriptional regulator with XRE-family HTH domain
MWREKIIEARKAKGITIKMMAEASALHLTEETVARYLNAKTDSPGVDKVIDLGQTVGLEPWELFADDAMVIAYRGFLTLQAEFDAVKAERDALSAEIEMLREGLTTATSTVNALNYENDRLRLTIAHNEKTTALQEKTIALQEEMIALLKREK